MVIDFKEKKKEIVVKDIFMVCTSFLTSFLRNSFQLFLTSAIISQIHTWISSDELDLNRLSDFVF